MYFFEGSCSTVRHPHKSALLLQMQEDQREVRHSLSSSRAVRCTHPFHSPQLLARCPLPPPPGRVLDHTSSSSRHHTPLHLSFPLHSLLHVLLISHRLPSNHHSNSQSSSSSSYLPHAQGEVWVQESG